MCRRSRNYVSVDTYSALEGMGQVLYHNGHLEPTPRHWAEALDVHTELDIAEAGPLCERLAARP